MPRPILATINPAAITHNLSIAKRYAPHSFLWAVIKANAYGHGIGHVYKGLQAADGLAMLDFAEAERVRELGWSKPILMLEGCFDATDIATCAALDLIPIIHNTTQLRLHAINPLPLTVQVKLNSGMNRLGFPLNAIPALELLAMPHLTIQHWVTHFADADSANGTTQALSNFETALEGLFTHYPRLRAPLCTSNSAATMGAPTTHHAAVRCGIMSYGSSPFGYAHANNTAAAIGLQPAMTLTSQLIAIQTLQAGDSVGYGSIYTVPYDQTHALRIGIVACGYADGYPRHALTGTPIAVNNILTRTIGRVSMDMLAVDLTAIPHATVGSTVELWGAHVPVDAVAHAANTIGYELLCALAPRVPVVII
jgi:alanine racemase